MNQKNNVTWYTSVGAIIIAFMFFWPVGIVLLYLRIAEKNGKYKVFSNMLFWTGIVLILFTAFLIVIPTEGEEDPTLIPGLFILFVIPGLILIFIGSKRKIKLKYYEKYLQCMGGKKRISIDLLSEKRKVDLDTVITDISEMINKKIISGYINDYNELILEGYVEHNENMKRYIKQTIVVKCKECGAQNSVTAGETVECEYCGTILQG